MIENHELAVFLARVVLGILFFFQGFDKVFRIGISNVADEISVQLIRLSFPRQLLIIASFITSYIELVAGILLFAGLFVNPLLIVLTIHMIFVALAFSLINPIWDMKIYLPRLVLLIFLLCVPGDWYSFGIDQFIQKP
ncbi:MAG: DoxX family protein [Flavobacteriales bacterium]